MKREPIDIFRVEPRHEAIHYRLLNWAAWARVRSPYAQCPMFKALGVKSNSWQWHPPSFRESVDILDAAQMEKAVVSLPERHRIACQWWYVHQSPSVNRMCQRLGVTRDGLMKLCTDARTMLDNRLST